LNKIVSVLKGQSGMEFDWRRPLTAAMLALACLFATAPFASAETRTLKLYYLHTREKAEITFKKDGRYIPSGLKQLNYFLRDWRRNEPTKMDPRLFDLVWEAYRSAGGRDYIHVVSAYRSPATNSMLRKRGRGVAKQSQHMLGKAMDFFIPGVKLKNLRNAGLRIQGGGVGYYPTSGSPFVHMDVGNVRHWPRMSRGELVSVFPNGKTLHVPTDGKPLPGYEAAVAAYAKRKGAPIAMASNDTGSGKKGGFFAKLFGGGADEEEESTTAFADATPRAAPAKPPVVVAEAKPAPAAPKAPTKASVLEDSMGSGQPPVMTEPEAPAAVEPPKPETAETIIAALPLRDVPRPMFAPRPTVDVGVAEAEVAPLTEQAAAELAAANVEAGVVEDGVPLPMARPAHTPQVQVAEAAPVVDPAATTAMAPRASATKGELAIETILANQDSNDLTGVPLPMARPGDAVEVAALAAPTKSLTDETQVQKADRVALAGKKPASPRQALRGIEADPVKTVTAGPATTPKAAKPGPNDQKREPKVVQKPVQTATVGRALSQERALSAKPDGKAFAVATLRDTPTEVYTAGFQQGTKTPDPKRFGGKAVTFMPVAKFQTN
jgi:uncharacterized protein YcbK (DUF882 family)